MKKKIILAGGTGFTGEYFKRRFEELGYEVLIISRGEPHITWGNKVKIQQALEGSELLINLAGKSVNCRYHEKNKKEILNSRTETTNLLGELVASCQKPPKLWVNSSTATIYRHAEDRPMTEVDGEIGEGFSVNVATAWEEAFFSHQLEATRQVALRIAIVLGDSGGVMVPYSNLAKFGLGGQQGNGKQMFSWIHIEDLFQMILYVMDNEHLTGIFNSAAPNPITNREFTAAVRKAYNRKIGLPAAKWMLEIGTFVLRTETELLLKSRWVIPERFEKEGFAFKYATIDEALEQIAR
ncbi:NAD-dependent epimerase [Alkalihalobacillus alcalophilus ATCC 27647 = CGMCC 1.3604]|uniref:NAD-dependent epimerase n=1 Tax=Alkalihalobacillus alcalophilus ATCC 27647 = CGMCC 1.3604 TaxID=1218173 RepID=A0A094WDW0_ALKAL|nr:TIGR01777 family oxidoreductase [Alkalihalobacillus alcalophilus]KGA95939.1 NAD-dependent epimerase [Alkalihalobacillus alcalophilus ATCC 27647 = CGMCC 1.3604]MED1564062.1 TIGR01777 family oxidoreductase [Alkalihalobacillus alcalophilus]THG91072.1 NAD-dependent epimerase [Alkalihalobacillus alcalophilus ATCC 27647 = CGMCC 1.3604]